MALYLVFTFFISFLHFGGCDIRRLVVFGNSLSDNGVSDGFGFRRYSSGNVWNEYLAESLCLELKNYAYGGALSSQGNYNFPGWSGIPWQVDHYLGELRKGRVPATDLIAYECGGTNDIYASLRDFSANPSNASLPKADALVENNLQCIKKLLKAGANKILVLSLVKPSTIPDLRENANSFLPQLDQLAAQTNSLLAVELMELQKLSYTTAKLVFLDFGSFVPKMVAEGFLAQGFTRTTDTMFEDQKKYIFDGDGIHLADEAHKFFAAEIKPNVTTAFFGGTRVCSSAIKTEISAAVFLVFALAFLL